MPRVVQNVHSVPETPSYGTELTLGARKDLDNYSKKNYTFVKILYSGVRSLYDFWKADNKF